MKCKVTLASAFLLFSCASWADQVPYYTLEEISVTADGANYGPFPTALSGDGEFIATSSMKASLDSRIDIGLPLTFNRDCQYDSMICDLNFYGSETAGQLSYENAYQAWRNAQSDAANGYSSYFMANTLLSGSDQVQIPYALDDSTDVKVNDVTNPLVEGNEQRFVVGYSSAPYDTDGEREFVRRAFVKPNTGESISLLADFSSNGGFSSAYKIKEVTYENGLSKRLVIGAASVSYPENSDEYFYDCYFSDEYDQRSTLNELVNCPGFDTQAWAWDVSSALLSETEVIGYALASEWLDDNQDNEGSEATYSASAFDINSAGIAVGMSTFERYNNSQGGRARAIIMQPSSTGDYAKPIEITQVYNGIDDQDDSLYNTWAQAINDSNIVVGNREYAVSKGVNLPVEFFVFDVNTGSIRFPLLDKKVATTEQRLAGETIEKRGASSFVFDLNEAGIVVGQVDDYDQLFPVNGGVPRRQSAFIYDINSEQSWFVNDLICSESNGVVSSPLIRVHTARVINDDGVILADGYRYNSASDYRDEINATAVAYKLTVTPDMSPNDSPNCWESDLLLNIDDTHEREGAASFWLWILSLPLLMLRRYRASN